jgi:hypothetical protein
MSCSLRFAVLMTAVAAAGLVTGCDNKPPADKPAPAAPTPPPAAPASAPAPAAAPTTSKVELKDTSLPVLATVPAAAPAQAGVRKVVDAYLSMKDAFVSKDVPSMKKTANAVASAAQAVPTDGLSAEAMAAWEAQKKVLTASTLAITAEDADLKAMRLQLAPLSEAAYAAAKSFGIGKVFVQYCPMANSGAGGYWLAAEDAIKNPYYGDEMLECGEVREVM